MIKFVDIWIWYGVFLHFVILLLLIIIEHLPKEGTVSAVDGSINIGKQQKKQRKSLKAVTQVFARRVLPLLEAAFVISYSVVACMLYSYNFG